MDRQEIKKIVMSPRIDARELEKYLRQQTNEIPKEKSKPLELPSIKSSKIDSFFDAPRLTKIEKKLPKVRYQSVAVKALRPDED